MTAPAAQPVRFRVRSGWTLADVMFPVALIPFALLDPSLLLASYLGPVMGGAVGIGIRSRRRIRELVVDHDGTLIASTASKRLQFPPHEMVRIRGFQWSRAGWFDGTGVTHNLVLTDDVRAALALRRSRGGSVSDREPSALERWLAALRDGARRWPWVAIALVATIGAGASAAHEWGAIRDEQEDWQTVPVLELVDRGVERETRRSGDSFIVEQRPVWGVTYELEGRRHTSELHGHPRGIDGRVMVDVRRSDPNEVRWTPLHLFLDVGFGPVARFALWWLVFVGLARATLVLAFLPVVRPVARPEPVVLSPEPV